MRLWRLSRYEDARRFDGGYGLAFDGRWNSQGRPVTYCATVPALCVLEVLVHGGEADLLPDNRVFVEFDAPDSLAVDAIEPDDLPAGWDLMEEVTKRRGDAWLDAAARPLLRVPSVVVGQPGAPDRNVIINHRHQDSSLIAIARVTPFRFDARVFAARTRATDHGLV